MTNSKDRISPLHFSHTKRRAGLDQDLQTLWFVPMSRNLERASLFTKKRHIDSVSELIIAEIGDQSINHLHGAAQG